MVLLILNILYMKISLRYVINAKSQDFLGLTIPKPHTHTPNPNPYGLESNFTYCQVNPIMKYNIQESPEYSSGQRGQGEPWKMIIKV